MKILLAAVFASSVLVTASVPAQNSETERTLQNLPPAVREALKAQAQGGATLRGLAEELTDGVTLYEAEMTVDGRTRDIVFDAQGRIVSLEEQKTLSEIPAAARAAIQKAVGTGKLVLVERVTKGERTFYEGHITRGDQTTEVKVDADGQPVE